MHVYKRHARFDSVGRDARVAKSRAGLIAKGRNRYALARYVQRRFHTLHNSPLGVQSCKRSLGPTRKHSPRYIDEREAFSTPYWPARNSPGRLGGHGHSPYRLSRRGIRHATFDRKRRSRDAAKRRVHANAGKRGASHGPAKAFFFFPYPFYPFAPTAPLPDFPFFVDLALFGA